MLVPTRSCSFPRASTTWWKRARRRRGCAIPAGGGINRVRSWRAHACTVPRDAAAARRGRERRKPAGSRSRRRVPGCVHGSRMAAAGRRGTAKHLPARRRCLREPWVGWARKSRTPRSSPRSRACALTAGSGSAPSRCSRGLVGPAATAALAVRCLDLVPQVCLAALAALTARKETDGTEPRTSGARPRCGRDGPHSGWRVPPADRLGSRLTCAPRPTRRFPRGSGLGRRPGWLAAGAANTSGRPPDQQKAWFVGLLFGSG